jgi:HD-GYP domain-containing protein (c-di-GMP phosphodiesterase class II)
MRSRSSALVRVPSRWVISAAFLLAVASVCAVVTLQGRASSSRDAQVELGHVQREFAALQSMPYDVIGSEGGTAQARLRRRMQVSESRIEASLAALRKDALTAHLDRLVAPYEANIAVLARISELLNEGRSASADALGPRSGLLQQRVHQELALAGVDYQHRASRSLTLAKFGSAAVILTLVSLFGVFYFRSRRAHVIAERLIRDNARLLLHDSQLQVIQRLATAAEYRDDDTGQHTRRVGELSVRIGAALGIPEGQLLLLGQTAPLHDVGKIGIPDSILLKRDRLTWAEFEQMKAHTTVGAAMLSGRNFPLLEMAEEIALTHHERWDGNGYPAGISGAEIPLVGRVVAVADVFDALTHARPYKDAWSVAEAVTEISLQRLHQFDPEVVDAFLRVLPEIVAAADLVDEPHAAGTAPRLGLAPAA